MTKDRFLKAVPFQVSGLRVRRLGMIESVRVVALTGEKVKEEKAMESREHEEQVMG